MDWIADPQAWAALATLTALEIVLNIDNVIFISIAAGKLPAAQQPRARFIGLSLAVVVRLGLLLSLSWIISLTEPLTTVLGVALSWRDLILLLGGLFLLGKSTLEIHESLESTEPNGAAVGKVTFWPVVAQIILLDIVFSFDSIITAIGMARHVEVMIAAVLIAIAALLLFAGWISAFVSRHPTFKMLALSFLLLIGVALIGEGLHFHIPKGYIYFAMAFSLFVELLNLRMRGPKAR